MRVWLKVDVPTDCLVSLAQLPPSAQPYGRPLNVVLERIWKRHGASLPVACPKRPKPDPRACRASRCTPISIRRRMKLNRQGDVPATTLRHPTPHGAGPQQIQLPASAGRCRVAGNRRPFGGHQRSGRRWNWPHSFAGVGPNHIDTATDKCSTVKRVWPNIASL